MLVTDSQEVKRFCDAAASADFVTVDTEFVREKTYWPQLCLIQIGTDKEAIAVDPLANGIDLQPLWDLLVNSPVLKVMHSASQDMQIIFNETGKLIAPVFDTQIAAMVCGYGDQPAYATLVQRILNESIDKRSQATDWSRRPLTDHQIEYALGDVTHLVHIFEHLQNKLRQSKRTEWATEEMQHFKDSETYDPDPRELWRKVRLRRPNPRALAVLREITEWREMTAKKRNLPKGWIVRDEALAEIALNGPTSPESLERVRGINERFAFGKDGKQLLERVRAGLDVPDAECPQPEQGKAPIRGHETLVALLQALLRLRCEENGIAAQLVANRKELDLLATEDVPEIRALSGWRREMFGEDALALKRGEIALAADGLSVRVVPA